MLRTKKLQSAYDYYVDDYSFQKGLSPKTIRNKKDILRKLIPFLDKRPLTLESCNQYVFYMFENGWKEPNSRLNIVKNLRAFVTFLFENGYLDVNFSKKIIKPKVNRKPLILPSEEDAEACIIAGTEPGSGDRSRSIAIKKDTRLCLQLIIRTGLRVSEALNLKGSDLSPFDSQPQFMVRSKGGRFSSLPIPEDMIQEMKNRVKLKRVFRTTEKTCNKNLRDGVSKQGLSVKITCHRLRDLFSISRLRGGHPLQLVSRALRHSNVGITDKYYSDYVLNDLVDVINDSRLIKNRMPAEQLIEKGISAFKKIVQDDPRIAFKIIKDNKGISKISIYAN